MKRYDLSREAQLNIKEIRRYSIDNWGDQRDREDIWGS